MEAATFQSCRLRMVKTARIFLSIDRKRKGSADFIYKLSMLVLKSNLESLPCALGKTVL